MPLEFAATAINYVSLSLFNLKIDLFRDLQVLEMCYTATGHHNTLKTHQNAKRKTYNPFKILNIECEL